MSAIMPAPNVLLVADFTYVRLSGGAFVYTAFAIDAYAGRVDSYEDWVRITGDDYETPMPRFAGDVEVMLPLLPARAMNRAGYARELAAAGFAVEAIEPADSDGHILRSAVIYGRAVKNNC